MFTVLHKDSSGNESLYTAKSVRWSNEEQQAVGVSIRVHAELLDGTNVFIPYSGKGSSIDKCNAEVFVMNDHGKTVARYLL